MTVRGDLKFSFSLARFLGGFYVNGNYYSLYKGHDGFRLRGSSVAVAINFLVDAYTGRSSCFSRMFSHYRIGYPNIGMIEEIYIV